MAYPWGTSTPQPQEWNRYAPLYGKCLTTGGTWSGEFIMTGYQRNQLKDGMAASPIKRLLCIATSSRYFNSQADQTFMRDMNDHRWSLLMAVPNQIMAFKFINCPNIPVVQATTNDGGGNYIRGQVPGFRFSFGFRYNNYLRMGPTETDVQPGHVAGQDPNLWMDREWVRMGYRHYRDRIVYPTNSLNGNLGDFNYNHVIQIAVFDCTDPNQWYPLDLPTASSLSTPVFYNMDCYVVHKKRTLFYVPAPLTVTHAVTNDPVPEFPVDWKLQDPDENDFVAGPTTFLVDQVPVAPF